jgi:hypothetical protein
MRWRFHDWPFGRHLRFRATHRLLGGYHPFLRWHLSDFNFFRTLFESRFANLNAFFARLWLSLVPANRCFAAAHRSFISFT